MKNLLFYIKKVKKKLKKARQIVMISHMNPDGDAIGSLLGLYHFLNQEKKKITVFSPDRFPDFLKWLPGSENIIILLNNKSDWKDKISRAEIIFCLDFNQLSRTGCCEKYIEESKALKILIDHHPYPEDFADYSLSDTYVSSTAELIYDFIFALKAKHKITKTIAECIYTGIMTDTGCFSFNSSNPKTFNIVSALLSKNINKDLIFSNVYDNYSENRMRFMGYCLNNKLEVVPDYNTAYISITEEELKKHEYSIGDTEGFVNLPLSIKGILFSVLFIEKKNYVKLSFRSKGSFEVNEFARKHFEGGGHNNAAGGECKLNLKDTINKFLSLLPIYEDKIKK